MGGSLVGLLSRSHHELELMSLTAVLVLSAELLAWKRANFPLAALLECQILVSFSVISSFPVASLIAMLQTGGPRDV